MWIVPLCFPLAVEPLQPEKCLSGAWVHCKVPMGVGTLLSTPSALKHQQYISSSGLLLDEILLWVFRGEILRVGLVVERKIWTVLLFDSLPFLVSMCVLPPVEKPGKYSQAGQNHKDDNSYDSCNTKVRYHTSVLWTIQDEKQLLWDRSKLLFPCSTVNLSHETQIVLLIQLWKTLNIFNLLINQFHLLWWANVGNTTTYYIKLEFQNQSEINLIPHYSTEWEWLLWKLKSFPISK